MEEPVVPERTAHGERRDLAERAVGGEHEVIATPGGLEGAARPRLRMKALGPTGSEVELVLDADVPPAAGEQVPVEPDPLDRGRGPGRGSRLR